VYLSNVSTRKKLYLSSYMQPMSPFFYLKKLEYSLTLSYSPIQPRNSSMSRSSLNVRISILMQNHVFIAVVYLRLKFQVNRSSGRHRNTGQHRLYEFCYLLPFDLWTFYLARILFLQGYDNWF